MNIPFLTTPSSRLAAFCCLLLGSATLGLVGCSGDDSTGEDRPGSIAVEFLSHYHPPMVVEGNTITLDAAYLTFDEIHVFDSSSVGASPVAPTKHGSEERPSRVALRVTDITVDLLNEHQDIAHADEVPPGEYDTIEVSLAAAASGPSAGATFFAEGTVSREGSSLPFRITWEGYEHGFKSFGGLDIHVEPGEEFLLPLGLDLDEVFAGMDWWSAEQTGGVVVVSNLSNTAFLTTLRENLLANLHEDIGEHEH